MSVLFAGTELEAFLTASAFVSDVASAGTYDAALVRSAMQFSGADAAQNIETTVLGSLATVGCHWEVFTPTTTASISAGFTMAELRNSAGVAVFRLYGSANSTLQAQFWTGSAWSNVGPTYALPLGARLRCDLKVIAGAAGSFEFYVNEVMAISGAGLNAAVTNFDKLRLYSLYNAGGAATRSYYSQVIVADELTVGWRYWLKSPTGNGANVAWNGSYTDVDELATSTVDYIEATAANDVETYTGAALAITGTVKAVAVSMQIKQVAGGPQNVQAAIRRGGVNYFTANLPGLTAGFGPAVGIFAVDPSTGVAWTAANAGAATTEFGVKAIA